MSGLVHKEKPDLNARLHEVPHKPGVYLMRDRLHRVIYVGKARDLRKRLAQYFNPSRKYAVDLKTRALLESVWDFEFHTVRSEPEALLLEGRLIKEFRPKYNISFRDDKRFLLVKVDPGEQWPRFRLARLKKDDGARYFGPFANAGALRQTIQFMRKKYGVLTYGRGAPTDKELKYSSYQVPSRLSDLTHDQYLERVTMVCSILEGKSRELISGLEQEMQQAASKLEFEKAAELRNMIEVLKTTTKPIRRFTRASLPSSIDPEADVHSLQQALGLPCLPKVMECFDISNISSTHIVASMVCFRDGVPDKTSYRRYRIHGVDGQNDFASMAEVVRRRYSRVLLESRKTSVSRHAGAVDFSCSQEEPVEGMRRFSAHPVRLPDLVIVDGGKGQLSSACKELQRLKLYELPIIGLAKEFEEIYRPGSSQPLRLPEDSGALKLLQRIRDEAHRMANGYHQLLMKRRIAESVLDDCPGISRTRKAALLKKFGSVERIRRSTVDEIAQTPGISELLAAQVAAFLKPGSAKGEH